MLVVQHSVIEGYICDVLKQIIAGRAQTATSGRDVGLDLTSGAMDRWVDARRTRLDSMPSGETLQNASIESFHGRHKGEWLRKPWLASP